MGVDLLDNPGLVAGDAAISWKSAIWRWMTQNGPNSMTAHHTMVDGLEFGQTIRSINGSLECVDDNTAGVEGRVSDDQNFVNILGVPAGAILSAKEGEWSV